jgi:hypothetical protein
MQNKADEQNRNRVERVDAPWHLKALALHGLSRTAFLENEQIGRLESAPPRQDSATSCSGAADSAATPRLKLPLA